MILLQEERSSGLATDFINGNISGPRTKFDIAFLIHQEKRLRLSVMKSLEGRFAVERRDKSELLFIKN